MLKNYLKIALRHLWRHKSYTAINILGLGVGLAACITIALWVGYELSYDRYHENSERIYRVLHGSAAATQPPLAPALKADYPDLVEEAVRFWPVQAPADIVHGEIKFSERHITFTDPSVFRVFSHPLVYGNKEEVLADPHSIALSMSSAKKYFGNVNPMGKTMNMWGQDLTVTGVYKDLPQNSHHRYDFLVPIDLLRTFLGTMMDNWTWNGFYTYLIPEQQVTAEQVEAVFPGLYEKYSGETSADATLQPLAEIYFNPAEKDIAVSGNMSYVYILASIALFVLVVASINFMNLSTAYSMLRKREVGMRKTLGAWRSQLVGQFLGEALLLSFFGLALALLLVEMTLPLFSGFTGKPLGLPYGAGTVAVLTGLALFVGLVAGSYPALFLSAFRTIQVLKSSSGTGSSGAGLRKALVVFQLVISTFLVIAAITVFLQLRFMQDSDLGFEDEQLLVTEAGDYSLLKEELGKLPGVQDVSAAYNVPGQRFPFYPLRTESMPADSQLTMRTLRVNAGFVEALGIEVVTGRSFDEQRAADRTGSFMINRAAAEFLGWENPLGKKLFWYDFSEDGTRFEVAKEGEVIGVVDDFNYASLHNPVEPLVLHWSGEVNWTVIRLHPGQTRETISDIRETWASISPDRPFWYYFLDQELDRQYGAEEKMGQVIGGLTILALFIGCIGLFGLTAFSARQRIREIGIRKVMGAEVRQIIVLLNGDVVKMVVLSFVIAVPIAGYILNRWLSDFAYHIELGAGIFAMAGGTVLLVALATASWQSVKAALANPVDSLRSE